MKKILFICFVLVLCVCMCTVCFAEEQGGAEVDIKEYIQEKIVPVVCGVVTSLVALGATLFKIAKTLKSVREAKETFENEARAREEITKVIEDEVEALKEAVKDVPSLLDEVVSLKSQVEMLAEILVLGFSSNAEIIKSGKGKRMSVLIENAKCTMQNAKLRVVEEVDPNNGREVANEKV